MWRLSGCTVNERSNRQNDFHELLFLQLSNCALQNPIIVILFLYPRKRGEILKEFGREYDTSVFMHEGGGAQNYNIS